MPSLHTLYNLIEKNVVYLKNCGHLIMLFLTEYTDWMFYISVTKSAASNIVKEWLWYPWCVRFSLYCMCQSRVKAIHKQSPHTVGTKLLGNIRFFWVTTYSKYALIKSMRIISLPWNSELSYRGKSLQTSEKKEGAAY